MLAPNRPFDIAFCRGIYRASRRAAWTPKTRSPVRVQPRVSRRRLNSYNLSFCIIPFFRFFTSRRRNDRQFYIYRYRLTLCTRIPVTIDYTDRNTGTTDFSLEIVVFVYLRVVNSPNLANFSQTQHNIWYIYNLNIHYIVYIENLSFSSCL